MKELTSTEIGYVAGILDGEGAISFHGRKGPKKQQYATPTIQVVQVGNVLPLWLKDKFGGSIHVRKNDKRPNRRLCYCWFVAGEKARIVLRAVFPYLLLNRRGFFLQ